MSTTTFSPTTSRTTAYAGTTDRTGATGDRVTWKRGLAVGVVAAVAATAVAAAFRAVGHPLAVTDGPIPLLAFGQMVLVATVVGIVMARHTSRTTFIRATIALTALSCVPDLALGDGPVSTAGLMLTHVVAAAIIVPRLARR
ncbi:MAG TPA: DUF6069 family protein [Nocardioides sp.]|uniref:DUF6069 family protein n=1 Tax=Nocardioides sp. TaxID=35761 RepID=UPI002E358A80|nr:DUF6069 family protein [Nocardioides sp.]HEX5087798.1 DUF6069 family protein [Nocardioides sp.]